MASRKTLFCHFPYLITEPGRVHRVADRDAEDRGLPGLASAAEEVIGEVSLRGNQTDPLAPVHRGTPWRGQDSGTGRGIGQAGYWRSSVVLRIRDIGQGIRRYAVADWPYSRLATFSGLCLAW